MVTVHVAAAVLVTSTSSRPGARKLVWPSIVSLPARASVTSAPSVAFLTRMRKPLATAEYPLEEARELRAVWALELAGTAEAKQLLEGWATARIGNRLGEEAAAALKRLQRDGK